MLIQESFIIHTPGRGMINITDKIQEITRQSNVMTGLCHVFLHHTSASILICENHEQSVQDDLESFFSRLSPDGDPLFQHTTEGPDDMPSHVRTVLTHSTLSLPITEGRVALGTWQGVYLWEHRLRGHQRKVTLTIQGE